MSQTETARCTGHCCAYFSLPYTPEGIEKAKSTLEDGEQKALC